MSQSSPGRARTQIYAHPENKRSPYPSAECEKLRNLLELASADVGTFKRPAFPSALACDPIVGESKFKRLDLPTVVSAMSFAFCRVKPTNFADVARIVIELLSVSEQVSHYGYVLKYGDFLWSKHAFVLELIYYVILGSRFD